jgi:hypothetical protein
MESELGNAAVLGVPQPSGVGPPKDQIKRVDGPFPQIGPVTAEADCEGQLQCHRALVELNNVVFNMLSDSVSGLRETTTNVTVT